MSNLSDKELAALLQEEEDEDTFPAPPRPAPASSSSSSSSSSSRSASDKRLIGRKRKKQYKPQAAAAAEEKKKQATWLQGDSSSDTDDYAADLAINLEVAETEAQAAKRRKLQPMAVVQQRDDTKSRLRVYFRREVAHELLVDMQTLDIVMDEKSEYHTWYYTEIPFIAGPDVHLSNNLLGHTLSHVQAYAALMHAMQLKDSHVPLMTAGINKHYGQGMLRGIHLQFHAGNPSPQVRVVAIVELSDENRMIQFKTKPGPWPEELSVPHDLLSDHGLSISHAIWGSDPIDIGTAFFNTFIQVEGDDMVLHKIKQARDAYTKLQNQLRDLQYGMRLFHRTWGLPTCYDIECMCGSDNCHDPHSVTLQY